MLENKQLYIDFFLILDYPILCSKTSNVFTIFKAKLVFILSKCKMHADMPQFRGGNPYFFSENLLICIIDRRIDGIEILRIPVHITT